MVKKKSVKKAVKKSVKKTKSRATPLRVKPFIAPVNPTQSKLNLAFKKLAFFLLLFLVSLAIYQMVPANTIYNNLFYLLSILFGFVSLALVVVAMILLLLRVLKKK